MTSIYHLRRVQKRHTKRVTEFLTSVFKTRPGFWKWKLAMPSKRPIITWMATVPNGEPISHYAYLPLDIAAGKERIPASLCTAMATHPKHRGRSLISRLSETSFQDAEAQSSEICIGFSNQAGLRVDKGSVGYGYRIIGSFATFACLTGKAIVSVLYLEPLKAKESFKKISPSAHALSIEKNPAYLEWRYRHHPEKAYRCFRLMKERRLVGYAVLRFREHRTEIMDIVLHDEHAMVEALNACAAHAKKQGSRMVTVSVLKNPFWKQSLSKAGFHELPKRARYHLTLKMTKHTPRDFKRILTKASAWRLMGGDIL
jgi:hypothetical protein